MSRARPPDRPWRAATSLPGWVVLPLRLFLGATFVFASLQKLANPAFFDATSSGSIQAQIDAARVHSPIGALLGPAVSHATAVGLVIAFGELAVGIGALLGLWTRVAALGGMVLSLVLWLTVSYHTQPYYYGSDVVFLFAWTPLLIGGSGDVLSLDAALARSRAGGDRAAASPAARGALTRRALLDKAMATGLVAAGGLVLGGITAALGRSRRTATAAPTPALRRAPAARAGQAGEPAGMPIGAASSVPVSGAARFSDPATGNPAYVVQPTAGTFDAFSAICTHAGCRVAFSQPDTTFVCPCHGSVFQATTGAVLQGPATRPLPRIKVTEGPDGQLYAEG